MAARIKPLFEEEARERQRQAADRTNALLRGEETLRANLREANEAKASEQAAAVVNVSARSVESAQAARRRPRPS